MHEGNEVAEERQRNGQRPDHVFPVPPVVDVNDLLDAALALLPGRPPRHQRLETDGTDREGGHQPGEKPQRLRQLKSNSFNRRVQLAQISLGIGMGKKPASTLYFVLLHTGLIRILDLYSPWLITAY